MAYPALADLKSYLGISSENDDDLLTAKLNEAISLFEELSGRKFEVSGDTTRNYDARLDVEGQTLYFDDCEFCEFTTVKNGDGSTIDPVDYVTEPRNEAPYYAITLKSSKCWTYSGDPQDAIEITGKVGYSASAPGAVSSAVMRLASFLYKQKDAQVFSQVSVSGGVLRVPQGFPKEVREVIDHYRVKA